MATTNPATSWQTGTVVDIHRETDHAKTFRLRLERPTPYLAGQHFVIRLTAPDGYTAMRSFSVASAPDASPEVEFTVERLDDGEVSTFLNDVVEPGDEIELRGPIGGWFVWEGTTPALLLGGGSGIVPLMAMLRLARRTGRSDLVRAIFSVRSPADLYYAAELPGPETTVVFTRDAPPTTSRPPGRLMKDDIEAGSATGSTAYVCGSTGFTNTATDLLMGAGWAAADIRVERFGPTGTC